MSAAVLGLESCCTRTPPARDTALQYRGRGRKELCAAMADGKQMDFTVLAGQDGLLGIDLKRNYVIGIVPGSPTFMKGDLCMGDKVVAVDGRSCSPNEEVRDIIVPGRKSYMFSIVRNDPLVLEVVPGADGLLGIDIDDNMVIKTVPGTHAHEKSGLQELDQIVAIDGVFCSREQSVRDCLVPGRASYKFTIVRLADRDEDSTAHAPKPSSKGRVRSSPAVVHTLMRRSISSFGKLDANRLDSPRLRSLAFSKSQSYEQFDPSSDTSADSDKSDSRTVLFNGYI
eukprot:1464704-Pleurochrysis_carterae.AAC.3